MRVYKVYEQHKIADLTPLFLGNEFYNLDKVIFPLEPLSFTTVRVVNSVVKALKIVYPTTRFIGVSNFLTYFHVVNGSCDAIAINSYRGDFYYRSIANGKFSKQAVATMDELKHKYKKTIFDVDLLQADTNLAFVQYSALYNSHATKEFIHEGIEVEYTYTPHYRKLGEQ